MSSGCCVGKPEDGGIPDGGSAIMNDGWKHKIFERDGYKCVYCGWDGTQDLRAYMLLEPDHLVPRDKGGSPDADNVVTSCHICNNMKGQQVFRSIEEANSEIERYYENVKRDRHQRMTSLARTSSGTLP
jgi:5-methylcytosine-specific restriction endonuclease McrA